MSQKTRIQTKPLDVARTIKRIGRDLDREARMYARQLGIGAIDGDLKEATSTEVIRWAELYNSDPFTIMKQPPNTRAPRKLWRMLALDAIGAVLYDPLKFIDEMGGLRGGGIEDLDRYVGWMRILAPRVIAMERRAFRC